MVVDDTYVDRYIAERNIRKYDFAEEIIFKDSAKNALDYLEEFSNKPDELPQIIFLDVRMPEMDGFGFLEEFAKLSESIKTKCNIVMLSTSINPNDTELARANKYVSQILIKPLDLATINSIKVKNSLL